MTDEERAEASLIRFALESSVKRWRTLAAESRAAHGENAMNASLWKQVDLGEALLAKMDGRDFTLEFEKEEAA